MSCLPAIVDPGRLWAQEKGEFDPNKPLFNKEAFEEITFSRPGTGAPVSNVRGFGYVNQDLSLLKRIPIGARIEF